MEIKLQIISFTGVGRGGQNVRLYITSFLDKLELNYLHIFKWFQALLSNTNNLIEYQSFVCTQLNSFKYCYVTLIILFNINHLLAHS